MTTPIVLEVSRASVIVHNKSHMTYTDLIGKPFEYGGRGPDVYDCWGLVIECYRRWHGVTLPDQVSTPSPRKNAKLMGEVAARDFEKLLGPQPGSVLMIRVGQFGAHVGFMISPTRMLHTLEETGATCVRTSLYERQILGAYRYVDA